MPQCAGDGQLAERCWRSASRITSETGTPSSLARVASRCFNWGSSLTDSTVDGADPSRGRPRLPRRARISSTSKPASASSASRSIIWSVMGAPDSVSVVAICHDEPPVRVFAEVIDQPRVVDRMQHLGVDTLWRRAELWISTSTYCHTKMGCW